MRGNGNDYPIIKMRAGDASTVVNEFEDALLASDTRIYQRGADLVHPVRLNQVRTVVEGDVKPVTDDRGRTTYTIDSSDIRRSPESLVLQSVDQDWLFGVASDIADWRSAKKVGSNAKWAWADPKMLYMTQLIKRRPARFPVLRAIATTPIIDSTGRVVQVPGYDEQSQMLLDFDPARFAPVPEQPTLDDAKVAYELLMRPFRKMPWANPASRSVAGSAMLTALVRASLRTAPMHVFDAPTAGTGKSKICDTIGILATGEIVPAMSQGKTAEEDEKRLSVALHYGDRVVLIDNVEQPITGDFLCSCCTQEMVQARILGLSERRITPVACLFTASGNNVTTAGDMSRRVIICRIDAGVERPDERKFDFDPVLEAKRDRDAMVIAGLTVLKAYHVAGRPTSPSMKPFGSFEDWSDWVRGALLWIGEADPCDTREDVLSGDAQKNDLIEVMDLWDKAFGTKPMPLSKVHSDPDAMALVTKFVEVTASHDWNAKSVGWWLRRNKDRYVGGRCFRVARATNDGVTWTLHGAAPKGKPDALPF